MGSSSFPVLQLLLQADVVVVYCVLSQLPNKFASFWVGMLSRGYDAVFLHQTDGFGSLGQSNRGHSFQKDKLNKQKEDRSYCSNSS